MELIKAKTELLINTTAKPVLKVTSNANTILHDLRTNEETVFLALKMILKGVNLRSAAEILDAKLDTVRRWLKISSEHSEEVNKVLMK
ncbi:MAG: helix-turn-helix domain containing protein [Methanobrevibacter sp.]|jgi:transposase-like protein|nr:helix-turn-helix domain containing protein [Candidatus Methanovirga aequatorialis]